MIISNFKIENRCARQTTIAIIVNNGKHWIGTNNCESPQESCPRKDLPTGVGYELCKNICRQPGHAEENACKIAGKNAEGGILFLLGHTSCCDNCIKSMAEHKIKEVIIIS